MKLETQRCDNFLTTLWQRCLNVIQRGDHKTTKNQHCYNVVCQLGCCPKSIKTTLNSILLSEFFLEPQGQHYIGFPFCNVVSGDNIAQSFFLYNVAKKRLRQQLLVQCRTRAHRHRFAENSQCNVVFNISRPTLDKAIICEILTQSLDSVVYTRLRQRCMEQQIACAMLAQSAQSSFHRNMTYTMLSWSAWANIPPENYLCNVDPQSTNNFEQESNLRFCLDLSEPTLQKEITCAILGHGWQIMFMRKIIHTMLRRPYWGDIA